MNLLIVDGYFMMHRARSGFDKGEFPIVFNFFRGLKALIDLHKPCKLVFVLEGEPKTRFAMMPEYKANRVVNIESDPKKYAALADFHRQKEEIINLLLTMPVMIQLHPDFECDDVIADIASDAIEPVIIASGDSDFIQLLSNSNIRLYHPIKKEFVSPPAYDYVSWKSLRGDDSDNIRGIRGIGDKTAEKLVTDKNDGLNRFLDEDQSRRVCYERNLEMIRFHKFSSEDRNKIRIIAGVNDLWPQIEEKFLAMGFNSFFKGTYFEKFKNTFITSQLMIKEENA